MKKTTLASAFAALRAERRITLLALAKSCGLTETTPHKVENGKPVRWETLHLLLSVGFRVIPGTERYDDFHRLWLMHLAEISESKRKGHSLKTLPSHSADAVKKFRAAIRDLDVEDTRKVMGSVLRRCRDLAMAKL